MENCQWRIAKQHKFTALSSVNRNIKIWKIKQKTIARERWKIVQHKLDSRYRCSEIPIGVDRISVNSTKSVQSINDIKILSSVYIFMIYLRGRIELQT